MSFGVETRAATAKAAVAANADAMRRIVNALRQARGRELATQWVSVYPVTNDTGAVDGYAASNSVSATSDVDDAAALIDAAAEAGANQISGPGPELEQRRGALPAGARQGGRRGTRTRRGAREGRRPLARRDHGHRRGRLRARCRTAERAGCDAARRRSSPASRRRAPASASPSPSAEDRGRRRLAGGAPGDGYGRSGICSTSSLDACAVPRRPPTISAPAGSRCSEIDTAANVLRLERLAPSRSPSACPEMPRSAD